MKEKIKYLKTFKYKTSEATDSNIDEKHMKHSETDGEEHEEQVDIDLEL